MIIIPTKKMSKKKWKHLKKALSNLNGDNWKWYGGYGKVNNGNNEQV